MCVFVKDDRTTADMWQNDRSTVTHLYRHAYTKTDNQSHSLSGWAGKLEVGGSEDHAELGFLYVFVLVCMSEFTLFESYAFVTVVVCTRRCFLGNEC